MSDTTGIEWAHSTVNIWTGCAKVSPACKNCYAETNSAVRAMEMRIGEALQVDPSDDGKRRMKMWGTHGYRYETANWERELRRLDRRAAVFRAGYEATGATQYARPRVFINSLSDTFEDWQGPVYRLEDGKPVVVAQSLDDVRVRFFRVAEECSELDLLLLTKRPKNVKYMVPPHWYIAKWPAHIWMLTTVEDQEHADKRIPELLKIPAKVRGLSVEPLLGPVDLDPPTCPSCRRHDTVWHEGTPFCKEHSDEMAFGTILDPCSDAAQRGVSWVIVGGESGTSARPMHPDWVRSIRDQCQAVGVSFFFKQWGEWAPSPEIGLPYHFEDGDHAFRIGKKTAGRLLDGREWNEVPR